MPSPPPKDHAHKIQAGLKAWSRLLVYAPFVKSLHFTVGIANEPCLLLLANYWPASTVFPNLRQLFLALPESQSNTQNVLRSLLNPSLRSFNLTLIPSNTANNVILLSIGRALMEAGLAQLETIRISNPWGERLEPGPISTMAWALSVQPSLVQLSLHCPRSPHLHPLIVAASDLPNLKDVNLSLPHGTLQIVASIEPAGFRSLIKVSGRLAAQDVPALIDSVSSTHVEDLDLCLHSMTNRVGWSLAGVRQWVGLKTARLRFVDGPAGWQELSALLFCPQIELLTIAQPSSPSDYLTDSRLESMAMAWVQLKELRLTAENTFQYSNAPELTLQGLSSLAAYCPLLKILEINVDSRGILPDAEHHLSGIGTEMESVNLWYSASADGEEKSAARWISTMWPSLSSGCTSWRGFIVDGPNYPEVRRWEQIWDNVRRNLLSTRNGHFAFALNDS